KAVSINAMFEESKQFWAYLIEKGTFGSAQSFINPVPHLSFVRGQEDIGFLKSRFAQMSKHHCFAGMEYTEDRDTLAQWMPLMMPGRAADEPVAATRALGGSDVNFGSLTNQLLHFLSEQDHTDVKYSNKVVGLERNDTGWLVSIKDLVAGSTRKVQSRFVFLGAGGAALPLLQMSGIPEGKGFGGFPVSGQWLRCDNQEVVSQHQAKVYSQADVGAPPMSVPHLDTRMVEGKKSLLFGPYAGFTTKFLKHGSFLDLPLSIRPSNILPMLAVARDNFDLTKYLMGEVMQSQDQRLDALRKFYPNAKAEDWRLETAGQRVQIIKKDEKNGGILQFGTELVASKDGSLAALLGASPGASVTVSIMLDLLARCFPEQLRSEQWQSRLQAIFKATAKTLETDAELYRSVQAQSDQVLGLGPTAAA
ncbi:MAG: malate dehydrogenase (quinone), partial [Pseudomonadaceae bacterium]|nr:malate dehydrogenase (quinone) [Pseudomonadaceae bacterium]